MINGKEIANLYVGGGLGVAVNKALEMYAPAPGQDFYRAPEGIVPVVGAFIPILARGLAKEGAVKPDILRIIDAFGIACLPKTVDIFMNGFKIPGAAAAAYRVGMRYAPAVPGRATYVPSLVGPVPHMLPTVPGPAIGREAETTLPQGTWG